MLRLTGIDLRRDPLARRYAKDELVEVSFATAPGVIQSRVGPNHYRAGDALLTGCDGDRWSVARSQFDAKYVAEAPTATGSTGHYRNRPVPVHARRYAEPFTVSRASGDVLTGNAGDWLLQYAPGDYGLADAARFARVYRPLPD